MVFNTLGVALAIGAAALIAIVYFFIHTDILDVIKMMK